MSELTVNGLKVALATVTRDNERAARRVRAAMDRAIAAHDVHAESGGASEEWLDELELFEDEVINSCRSLVDKLTDTPDVVELLFGQITVVQAVVFARSVLAGLQQAAASYVAEELAVSPKELPDS